MEQFDDNAKRLRAQKLKAKIARNEALLKKGAKKVGNFVVETTKKVLGNRAFQTIVLFISLLVTYNSAYAKEDNKQYKKTFDTELNAKRNQRQFNPETDTNAGHVAIYPFNNYTNNNQENNTLVLKDGRVFVTDISAIPDSATIDFTGIKFSCQNFAGVSDAQVMVDLCNSTIGTMGQKHYCARYVKGRFMKCSSTNKLITDMKAFRYGIGNAEGFIRYIKDNKLTGFSICSVDGDTLTGISAITFYTPKKGGSTDGHTGIQGADAEVVDGINTTERGNPWGGHKVNRKRYTDKYYGMPTETMKLAVYNYEDEHNCKLYYNMLPNGTFKAISPEELDEKTLAMIMDARHQTLYDMTIVADTANNTNAYNDSTSITQNVADTNDNSAEIRTLNPKEVPVKNVEYPKKEYPNTDKRRWAKLVKPPKELS